MNKDLISRVEEALQQIRPYLEKDGGNVSLLDISDDFVVSLELQGACKSCSMSMMTLKAGIEETIMRSVPEIKSVIAVNMHSHTSVTS
ncbi:MAG TPA: NifU family protein [Bacteroidia bacterium]|jgi:Fe-S cluster biogenesis protein NfuA|nr:NifU family protein [Bacteroidia bacterium]